MRIYIFIIFNLGWIAMHAQPVQSSLSKTPYFSENIIQVSHKNVWGIASSGTLPYFNATGQAVPSLYFNDANQIHGMFCKMEYKIEQKSKLAPRFRLGSLNYTEWMEGKRELFSRYWK
jgi:hypothetical protein